MAATKDANGRSSEPSGEGDGSNTNNSVIEGASEPEAKELTDNE